MLSHPLPCHTFLLQIRLHCIAWSKCSNKEYDFYLPVELQTIPLDHKSITVAQNQIKPKFWCMGMKRLKITCCCSSFLTTGNRDSICIFRVLSAFQRLNFSLSGSPLSRVSCHYGILNQAAGLLLQSGLLSVPQRCIQEIIRQNLYTVSGVFFPTGHVIKSWAYEHDDTLHKYRPHFLHFLLPWNTSFTVISTAKYFQTQ